MSLTGGYDQRVVPFEYICSKGNCVWTKQNEEINLSELNIFRGVGVATTSALIGLVYDGGPWLVELRYNAIPQSLGDEGVKELLPVSLAYAHKIGPVELDMSLMQKSIMDVAVTYVYNEKVQMNFRASSNASKMTNDAPGQLYGVLDRKGGPNPVYALEVGFRF